MTDRNTGLEPVIDLLTEVRDILTELRPTQITVGAKGFNGSAEEAARVIEKYRKRLENGSLFASGTFLVQQESINASTTTARHRIQNAVNAQSDFAAMLHALIDTVGAELDSLHAPAQVPSEVVLNSLARDRGLAVDDISKLLEQFPQHLRVADVLAVLRGFDDFSGSGHDGAPQIDPVGGVDGVGAPNPTHGFPHEGGAQ